MTKKRYERPGETLARVKREMKEAYEGSKISDEQMTERMTNAGERLQETGEKMKKTGTSMMKTDCWLTAIILIPVLCVFLPIVGIPAAVVALILFITRKKARQG